ncbi:MAG: thioredoxin family protein [Planctomycetaceae bacterium]|nr:thioredoxin family protein [Planctomycetaceae bacterium]
MPGLSLLACLVQAIFSGGCGGGSLTAVDSSTFDSQVLGADKPVLVEFYKAGCPTCLALEPGLDQLAQEYQGRVIFAQFKVYEWYFGQPAPEIKDRYDIWWTPTVILFVKGQERHRWVGDYVLDDYRNVLNEVAGAAGPNPGKLTPPAPVAKKAPSPE